MHLLRLALAAIAFGWLAAGAMLIWERIGRRGAGGAARPQPGTSEPWRPAGSRRPRGAR